VTLLGYRLRPLPGMVLIGLPIALLAAAWWLAPRLQGSGAIRFLQFTAVPLGLVAAFTVSRDVDAPEPVLASVPHPYWRTPAARASLWFIAAVTVLGLIGNVLDARVLGPLPVDAAVSLARADFVLVFGLAFIFSIRWGSFMGGASALVCLLSFAVVQRLWRDWPLRVLDTVDMPRWEQARASLLFTGAIGFVAGLLYLRARGLPVRHLFVWVMAWKPRSTHSRGETGLDLHPAENRQPSRMTSATQTAGHFDLHPKV
jgi:hypothetical protein